MKMIYSPSEIMRQWLYIREHGANKGRQIEALQHWGGGVAGDSYCCESGTVALEIAFQGRSPIPVCGACQTVYEIAKKNNWVVPDDQPPMKDDIFLYVTDADHAHHLGFITEDNNWIGIAGNTSEDGKSSNGTGFFEHEISSDRKHVKLVRYPKN